MPSSAPQLKGTATTNIFIRSCFLFVLFCFLLSAIVTLSTLLFIRGAPYGGNGLCCGVRYCVNLSLYQSVDTTKLHPISRLACLLTLRQLFLVWFNNSQTIDALSGGLEVIKIFQQLNGLMPFDHSDVTFGTYLFSCQRTAV